MRIVYVCAYMRAYMYAMRATTKYLDHGSWIENFKTPYRSQIPGISCVKFVQFEWCTCHSEIRAEHAHLNHLIFPSDQRETTQVIVCLSFHLSPTTICRLYSCASLVRSFLSPHSLFYPLCVPVTPLSC